MEPSPQPPGEVWPPPIRHDIPHPPPLTRAQRQARDRRWRNTFLAVVFASVVFDRFVGHHPMRALLEALAAAGFTWEAVVGWSVFLRQRRGELSE